MTSRVIILAAALVGAAASWNPIEAQQTGAIVVTVKDKQSGVALSGAQVTLQGGASGGLTDANGRFLMPAIPAGNHTIVVTYIGYGESRRPNVAVTAGQTATLAVELETAVLELQQLVVTGVTDPTSGVKLPYSVARIGAEQLQVPTTGSALNALTGKVAGAQIIRPSGQPGTGVNIQLRSPTGFESSGSPLIVVDGVVISREMSNTSVDFEALDIESIEVIKGAAAASLFGSRAAAGVVTITTNRGRNQPVNQTRVSARTELGASSLGKVPDVNNAHFMLMDPTKSFLVNAAGEKVTWANRVSNSMRMMEQPFPCVGSTCPGPIYDNLHALYNPGRFFSQNFGLAQNSENTTFLVSLTRYDEQGSLEGNDGFWRNTGRVNLDHRIGAKFSVSLSAQHVRSNRDVISGSPFTDIFLYPGWVDLTEKGPDGKYLMVPDPDVEQENPLWRQTTRDHYDARTRTLGSLNVRWNAIRWATLDAQLSYDRADTKFQEYVPKGVPLSTTTDQPSNGSLYFDHRENNTVNGAFGAIFQRQFGDLNARFTTRGTFEKEDTELFFAEGLDFVVEGVRDLSAVRTLNDMGSNTQDIRANGYFGDLALDFKDRYIASVLVRRDGSSLFGPLERWHTYRRGAAAYRISQEPWFNLPHIDEFKFKYAMGEAGGRPSFSQQYATYNISRTSGLTRENSGNAQLKPQFTREQEVGVDIIAFNNRVSLELVYAHQMSKDQVITIPAAVATGFSSLSGNAAVLTGKTYEATLEVHPVRRRNTRWSINAVAFNSDTRLTEWNRSCFWGSNTSREHEFTCAGQRMGDFWVWETATRNDQLPAWITSMAGPCRGGTGGKCAEEFAVNDEGHLVWVGRDPTGNVRSYKDGHANSLWNASAANGGSFAANGITYSWGRPFQLVDEIGLPLRVNGGSSLPDLNYSLSNNIRYKGLSTYFQFRGQLGGKIYNQARHYLYVMNGGRHADNDQSAKPDELKKNTDYYAQGLGRGSACNSSTTCTVFVDHFLEDATYLKLGELNVRYRFDRAMLGRLMGSAAPAEMSIGVNGRNLFTVSKFSGMDPDRGSNLSRREILNYPHLRNFAATVDIIF